MASESMLLDETLGRLTFEDRLQYYSTHYFEILKLNTDNPKRIVFYKWRAKDLQKLNPDGRKAQIAKERAQMKSDREAEATASFERRCGDRKVNIFDPDPANTWNELYRALYVRQDSKNCHKGWDTIEPYLYKNTSYLFKEPAFLKSLSSLNNFLDDLRSHPPKSKYAAALMQRNLIQVYMWLEDQIQSNTVYLEQARSLIAPLATAINLLALPENEIRKLTVSSPLLDDSFELVSTKDVPAARLHHSHSHFGSAFFVYASLPSKSATFQYFKDLSIFTPKRLKDSSGNPFDNPNTPQFPRGTKFALVRQSILLSRDRKPIVSPIVESVQMRTYNQVISTKSPDPYQTPFFAELSQKQLLSGEADVYRTVKSWETHHVRFLSLVDPFEKNAIETGILEACLRCHSQGDFSGKNNSHGIHSVLSYSRSVGKESGPESLGVTSQSTEAERILQRALNQSGWKSLLQRY